MNQFMNNGVTFSVWIFFFFFFGLLCMVCTIVGRQQGIKPKPPAVRVQSPNLWTAREFPPVWII